MLIALAICFVASVPTRAAEKFPLSFRAPDSLPKQTGRFLQGLAQRHADGMVRQLNLQINAVDRACDLSGEQREKLELASLGAVQDSLDEWLAPILSGLATGSERDRTVLLTRLGAPRDVRVEVLGDEEVFIEARPPPRGFFAQLFGGEPKRPNDANWEDDAVLQHPIFTATLDAVLTDQQQETFAEIEQEKRKILAEAEKEELKRLADAQTARDVERTKTRTERLARKITQRLALDDAQQQQIIGVLEQMTQPEVVRWRLSTSGISSKDAAEFTLPHLPPDQMRQILTPGQLAVWQEIVKRSTNSAAVE